MSTFSQEPTRLEFAKKFGAELQRAMTARKMRPFHLLKAMGGGYSAFTFDAWLHGRALPRLDRAIKLAEVLDWPRLATIARDGRTGICQRPGCGQTFITETGRAKLYCSPRCYKLVHEYELGFAHAERKKAGSEQAYLLKQAAEGRAALDELTDLRRAVAAMCAVCEPEGYCRTPDCALRPVSPLPLLRAQMRSKEAARLAQPNRWRHPSDKAP